MTIKQGLSDTEIVLEFLENWHLLPKILPKYINLVVELKDALLANSRCDLSRFSPWFDQIFQGKRLIQFLANKMQDFRNFALQNCIVIFDVEQVCLKLQFTNFKNKKATANPKPQALEKITLNPKP